MSRYWVSWWSGNYADEGCTKPPFKFWNSGTRDRANPDRDECSLCAVIDQAGGVAEVLSLVRFHFPDAEQRFCEPKPDDWQPGDRFQ